MGNIFGFEWEYSLIIFFQEHFSTLFMNYLDFMANFGDEIAVVLVVGFFYWCYDKKVGYQTLMYTSIGAIAFPLLKNIACRIRPYMADERITCIRPAYEGDPNSVIVQGYSFPSGHAVNSMTVYAPLFKRYKNTILRVVIAIIIVSICLCRMALGCHYPTDVLAGLVIGVVVWTGFDYLTSKFDTNKVYLVLIAISTVGFLYCSSDDFFTGYGMLIGSALANIFEKKYVNFENTRDIREIIIRLLLGVVLFLGLSKGTKLPFSEEFLYNGTLASHLVRVIRYVVIMFLGMGVYPMCFKYIKFKKK